MKAKFTIENVDQLVPALPVSCVFSQRGGIIGSSDGTTWCIQDTNDRIKENSARIVVIDDRFTIESLSGMRIYINGAKAPIKAGRPVLLSDKDTLKIGDLYCLAQIRNTPLSDAEDISSITSLSSRAGDANALVIDGEFTQSSTVDDTISNKAIADPVEALNGESNKYSSADPLDVLDADIGRHNNSKLLKPEDTDEQRKNHMTSLPDHTNSIEASIRSSKVKKDKYGFDEVHADGDGSVNHRVDNAQIELGHPVDHVALRPLSRALGLPLGEMGAEEAQRVLADIGGALRAAVGGVNKIYNSREGNANRFPLTTLHLHAVEDNPLRFSNDTDEALQAMFAKRGAVHLSAPAAMTEAVEHFDAHQTATEQAIDKALDSVLTALLPRALERRFRAYAPNENPEDGEERDAWCWGMYKAYFSELKSERQKGLQMLFWEVFQHEYQGIMRTREMFDDLESDDE